MKRLLQMFRGIFAIILFVFLLISTVGASLLEWFSMTFGVTIREIIYTVKSPLKGADTQFLRNAVIFCLPAITTFCLIIIVYWLLRNLLKQSVAVQICFSLKKREINVNGYHIIAFCGSFLLIVYSAIVLYKADQTLKVVEFIRNNLSQTHIYEDYYVAPVTEQIYAENNRNLIYIYLESMETTYASKDVGGFQEDDNYIPLLTDMANEEISFSNSDLLGGFHCSTGTGWTAVALFASETGLPFCFPIAGNEDFGNREAFATGVNSLGDILKEKGYYQEFLCGSDATFGGRKAFFEQHGNYEVFDWFDAVQQGYVTEDDYVWWGLEDYNLYKIAKDELTRMAKNDEPFNLTMLTVDTHHVDGWVCELCQNEYPEQLANVVKCADRQIFDFISWCKKQPWYSNTTIVIQGDHPRMDTSLVDGIGYYDRTMYNCFINTPYDKDFTNQYNREWLPMDMFPTVLSAMGFYIPNDRLGLGTNMFSDKKTLAEEMGYDYVNKETSKYSAYYIDTFS